MKEFTLGLVVLIGLLLIALGLGWLAEGNEFFLYKVFAPKREAVRREVFEESKAYNQGMIQELQSMRWEYIKAQPEHKQALASLILHRAADYPKDRMPVDLRQFIDSIEPQTGNGFQRTDHEAPPATPGSVQSSTTLKTAEAY